MSNHPIATVAGRPVPSAVLDAAETRLRAARGAAALPAGGTREGRQLQIGRASCWVTFYI